mmetsp:Transcript_7445/g.19352  ORF Transcript_7445/g.19352 Transcript_7445/m.19352 type:complete len:278 (-) Transcript_7445:151-984(-)
MMPLVVSGQQSPSATEASRIWQPLCAEHKAFTTATLSFSSSSFAAAASASAALGEGGAAGSFPIAFTETSAKSDVTEGTAPVHSVTTHGAPRASLAVKVCSRLAEPVKSTASVRGEVAEIRCEKFCTPSATVPTTRSEPKKSPWYRGVTLRRVGPYDIAIPRPLLFRKPYGSATMGWLPGRWAPSSTAMLVYHAPVGKGRETTPHSPATASGFWSTSNGQPAAAAPSVSRSCGGDEVPGAHARKSPPAPHTASMAEMTTHAASAALVEYPMWRVAAG